MQTLQSPSVQPRPSVRIAAGRALAVFLALMIALTLANRALNELATAQVDAVSPQRGALERRIDASGQLAATNTVPVYAEAPVRVGTVHVRAGQQVATGDPLFTLEAEAMADWVAEARQKRDEESIQLAEAQQALAYAKADMSEYALKDYAEAQSDVDKAQAAYEDAVEKQGSARNIQYKLEAWQDAIRTRDRRSNVRTFFEKERELAQAEQEYADALAEWEKAERIGGQATVLAPHDAQIVSVDIQTGTTATTESAALMLAPLDGELELMVSLSEEEAKYLAVGDEADVTVSSQEYSSFVTAISPSTTDAGKYDLFLPLPADAGRIGMNADVQIRKRTQNYDLLIPLSALHQDNVGYYVYQIIQRDGALGAQTTVARADVSLIERDSTRAAVQGGVTLRDQIAARSDRELHDGDRVRLKEE